MKRNLLVLLALNVSFVGIANADLISVDVVAGQIQHPDGLHQTWRIIARFDNGFDQISAIAGLPDQQYNPIEFISSSELYNQALFAGLTFNDFPSAGGLGGEAWDSYVTIGATAFPANTQFTANFLGRYYYVPPPPSDIIQGDHIGPVYDGAWFFFGAPPTVSSLEDIIDGNDTFDVIVAQFTLPTGSSFTFTGNVLWYSAAGDSEITPFEVEVIPAPATLAMLILAGLATNRRRRY